jgi:hypothetical protein
MSLLWVELMKNLSAAAEYQPKDGCGPMPSIPTTAVGLLHPLCIGASNNPTVCYCSSIDHLDSSMSLQWVKLMKNLSAAAK